MCRTCHILGTAGEPAPDHPENSFFRYTGEYIPARHLTRPAQVAAVSRIGQKIEIAERSHRKVLAEMLFGMEIINDRQTKIKSYVRPTLCAHYRCHQRYRARNRRLFVKDQYNLVLVARNVNELEDAASELRQHGVDVVPIAKDLFLREAPFELYDEVKQKGIVVNVLVNDAGQGQYGEFAETDINR